MTQALYIELDAKELTVRLMEVGLNLKRPQGKTAVQILEDYKDIPEIKTFHAMSLTALEYLRQCIKHGSLSQ